MKQIHRQSLPSQMTRDNFFDRILRKQLLDCALCGKRVARMREETVGVPLCRSCFQLILEKAAQTPEHRKLAGVSLTWLKRSMQVITQER